MLDPRECVFIDEAMANSIARQAGLEPGLNEWRTHFHWYGGELNTYVWTVESTLEADGLGYRSGWIVVIDANSGAVLQSGRWVAEP